MRGGRGAPNASWAKVETGMPGHGSMALNKTPSHGCTDAEGGKGAPPFTVKKRKSALKNST